jgi:saccharopine dehydrogenase (NAD+, L-lysine-forming)
LPARIIEGVFIVTQTLWLRAETRLNERRTPLIPVHAGILVRNGYRVIVEASTDRIFPDSDWAKHGCVLVAKGSWRFARRDTLILGLKELPDESFALRHRHMYFAHAYEHQRNAADLLERFRRGGGMLYDLEQIKDRFGAQLVTGGAGYFAGLAAATACIDIWKQKQQNEALPYRVPRQFLSMTELVIYARHLVCDDFQRPRILVIGHRGKSGSGVTRLLDEVGLAYDWSEKITADRLALRERLHEYELIFNCIKLSHDTPLFLNNCMIGSRTKIRLIGDISCEATHPRNPLALYSTPTSFTEPVHRTKSGIDVMAIDNITAMLPVECSEILSEQIFPFLCQFLMAGGTHDASPFQRVVNSFRMACADVRATSAEVASR